MSRIVTLIDGPVFESLAAIQKTLAQQDQALGEDFVVQLEQLVDSLTSARRRTAVFAADLAKVQAGRTNPGKPAVDGLTRREKAGQALDALEGELGEVLADNVHVNRFRFDRTASPVGIGGGWAAALASVLAGTASSPQDAAPPPAGEQADAVAAGPSTNLTSVLEQLASDRSGESTRLALVLYRRPAQRRRRPRAAGLRHATNQSAGVCRADRQRGPGLRRVGASRRSPDGRFRAGLRGDRRHRDRL